MMNFSRISHQTGSTRDTTTFEVPLFLSPSRYQPPQVNDYEQHDRNTRSRSSTRSLIDAASTFASRIRPITLASSRYSSPTASPILPQRALISSYQSPEISQESIAADANLMKEIPQRRRRRRKRSSVRRQIQALIKLCIVFGLTLLVALITYIALTVTSTATGLMFHILMILLILSLTGVFVHNALRIFILSRNARQRRANRRQVDDWYTPGDQQAEQFPGELSMQEVEREPEHTPISPIRIIMAEDEEAVHKQRSGLPVKYPPPVYGNFRSSKRINPNLVHWQKVPPSPLTPTYDEAVLDMHHPTAYRPPSYIESEGGVTQIIEQGRRDVDRALKDIHPLERHRVVQLVHNMI